MVQLAQVRGAQTPLAIGLHIVGEHRVGQHGHMAEHVVEHVRRLEIVQAVGAADEAAGGKAAMGQVVEEHGVRDEARDGDDAPAGQAAKLLVEAGEVGDALPMKVERVQATQKGVAGAALEEIALALIEGGPDPVLRRRVGAPSLVDRPVRLGAGGRPCLGRRGFHRFSG